MRYCRSTWVRLAVIPTIFMVLILTGCFGNGRDSTPYTVSGTVRDGDGKGIADAEIIVTGGISMVDKTKSDGTYILTGLTGTVTIRLQKAGWYFEPTTVNAARSNLDFIGTQSLYFEDANLEAAIRDELAKPDGPLLTTDVRKMLFLDADGRGIKSLVGIENLVQLEMLYLNDNKIQDIAPLAHLVNMKWLYMSRNQIEDICPLEGLHELQALYIGTNQIRDIGPVAGLSKLTGLGLDNNQITEIDAVEGLLGLHTLYLGNNPIESISALKGLTDLASLRLIRIPVTDLTPLQDLTNLNRLWLGWHPDGLTNISALANFNELEFLWLAASGISDINVLASLTGLKELHIGMNEISDISILANLGKLEILRLFDNQIDDIAALEHLAALQELFLRNNPLNLEDPETLRILNVLDEQGTKIDIPF